MTKNKLERIKEIYKKISTPEEQIIDLLEQINKEKLKGDDGKTPIKGEDYFTIEEIEEFLKFTTPKKGVDYKDGKTPTEKELREIIIPLIPEPLKGKDGNIITPEEVRNKLKELKEKNRLSIFDLKDTEYLQGKGKDTIQWNAVGGLSKVSHDTTLSGSGTDSDPLHANSIGGGQVNTLVAGTGISVNSTDPVNPIVTNSAPDQTVAITAGTNITSVTGTYPNFTINAATQGGSPLTTKGDIYVYSTTNDRLPVGVNGQILSADSTQTTGLKWIANSGGSMVYPLGTGVAVVTSGSSWGTTLGYGAQNTGSYLVQRDASGNAAFNNVINTVTQISASGQTIAMTYGSSGIQEIYGTGNVTFNLPDSTYLYQGESYYFNNNSTGLITIYKYDGTTLVGTVTAGGYAKVDCDNNSTVNGEWDIHYYIATGGTSSQFVKGDGSLDSSVYITSAGTATNFSGSLSGDVTGTQGATVVGKINGTSLAGLGTGILKNTTGTGVPSIAIAADFPILNQNTSGTATNLSGTPLLPTGTTAHTYSQADNSTDIATTAYVDTGLGTKAATGQTMYIGTTSQAINRASASEGLSGITGLTPGADFTLTQNSVAALTSVESGAVANTLYLKAGNVGIGTTAPGATLSVISPSTGTYSNNNLQIGDNGSASTYYKIGRQNTGTNSTLGFLTFSGQQTGYGGYYFTNIDGTANVVIANNGNVGIGTTGPDYPLTVYTSSAGNVTFPIKVLNKDNAETAGSAAGMLFSAGIDTSGRGKGALVYALPAGNSWNRGDFYFLQNSTGDASNPTLANAAMVIKNNGNVGIGTTNPNASALLDMTSTTKGFAPPRGTNTQMLAISTPPEGLVFYDLTNHKLNCYDGSVWQPFW